MNSVDRKAKLYLLEAMSEHPGSGLKMGINDSIGYYKARFISEMGRSILDNGRANAMDNWLRGLAIDIKFMNGDIEELAVEWGTLDKDASDSERLKITNGYWNFMATKLLQLFDGYRVPKGEIKND